MLTPPFLVVVYLDPKAVMIYLKFPMLCFYLLISFKVLKPPFPYVFGCPSDASISER